MGTRFATSLGVMLIVATGLGLYQRGASAGGVYVALQSNTIAEIDRTACEAQGARQVCTSNGIPGDNGLHNMSVQAPSSSAAFLGGYARTYRMGLDQSYGFTCMMNPPQPPTPQNSLQRRCSGDARDMSVENCTITTGPSPTLSCEYMNTTNAYPKMLELCGCWR